MGKSDRGTDFDGRANRALHYQAQCRRQAALDWANRVELESDDDLPDSYWDTVPDEPIDEDWLVREILPELFEEE